MERVAHRPWYRQMRWWVLAGFIAVVVVIWVGLQPFVAFETRRSLDRMEGFRGEFKSVHLSLIPLRYTLTNLKLMRTDAPPSEPPMFFARRFTATVVLSKLAVGKVVASLTLDKAKINLVQKPKRKSKLPSLGTALQRLAPADLDRLAIKDSEIDYRLEDSPGAPEVWIHDLNATLENVATRVNLAHGITTLAVSGTVQSSGALSAFVTADPLKKSLTFAGEANLVGLKLTDVDPLIASKSKMKAEQGTLDMFARFDAKDGSINGGVKPVLKNVKITSASPKLFDKIKGALGEEALKIFSDRVPGRNAVATVIPIKGNLNQPDLELWPTVFGVMRNAFVEGLAESYRNTPPPTAPKRQGVLSQARHALSKHGAPQAQPPPRQKKEKKK